MTKRGTSFGGRDILSINDFLRDEMDYLFEIADSMAPLVEKRSKLLEEKILATLFFEPSTRTRLSFESAMLRLGGRCIGFHEPKGTSVEKGENLADTIRVVESYADLIVIRHPLEGAARLAADFAGIPVINAGSGSGEHPTQALLDMYTIRKEMGRIDELEIGLLGDLKYGRTAHSLAYALSRYNVKIHFVSPELLRMREEVLRDIKDRVKIYELDDLSKIIDRLDVLYITRIQRERFVDPAEYEKVKKSYRLSINDLESAKDQLVIMHPLPRVDEIDYKVDETSHAKYFKQVGYGVLVRMALIALIFEAIE